jgi:hypothetical protein
MQWWYFFLLWWSGVAFKASRSPVPDAHGAQLRAALCTNGVEGTMGMHGYRALEWWPGLIMWATGQGGSGIKRKGKGKGK